MKDFTDTLLYFVPAVLVLGAMFLMVKKFLDKEYKVHIIEARKMIQKDSLPLKLQAYERLVLFLERISPSNLLVRTHRTGISAPQLHADLLATIRAEFDHNLSQQIYISTAAWDAVKDAKEETLKIFNTAYGTIGSNGSGMQLSSQVFEEMMRRDEIPTQHAIEILKKETRQLLG